MSNQIKISIVVPVYKVPKKFLENCVNSLIQQTLKDIEIILVDDNYYDESGKYCDELAKNDSRIKVIHQKNAGLSAARNTGVRNAVGEWVSFIDGDDWIEKEAYEYLYNQSLETKELDLIMFGYVKDFNYKSIATKYEKYFENEKIYETDEEILYLQKMMLNYNASCSAVPTKLIKRKLLIEKNLFHDEKLRQGAEGIEFCIRLIMNAKKVKFINKNFYHYIYNDNSITTVHNEENHKMVLNCFKKIKTEVDENNIELMKCFYNRMIYVIITTAISGYFAPTNPEKYIVQRKKYKEYLKDELVVETLNCSSTKELDKIRKITYFCIKNNWFAIVKFIAIIRNLQKNRRKK